MKTSEDYEWLLVNYPEYINKEQLCKVCHISKRTAQHLLAHGVIPFRSTGKKTRQYAIAMVDVVHFLKQRDENPEYGIAPDGWYVGISQPCYHSLPCVAFENMEQYYKDKLKKYPDVLSVKDVVKFTGYVKTTVVNWCGSQRLRHFVIGKEYKIPQTWLIEFLMNTSFSMITVKSKKHKAHLAALAKLHTAGQASKNGNV